MKNKILILLMSCNKDLYCKEEQACRETFLKDAEEAGIKYYFYKGLPEGVTEQYVNQEERTIYLDAPDNLAGTGKKTVAALKAVLETDEWDYVLKTNVSTWIDIDKVQKAVNTLPGPDDLNVYGARFLANESSKRAPFPRGHFVIYSRKLVGGILDCAGKMANVKSIPKTDDTFLGLVSLYYIQKVAGEKYVERIKEVPAVNSWHEDISSAQEYSDALCIRCKNEEDKEKSADNMRKAHSLKRSPGRKPKAYFRDVDLIETKFGLNTYATYLKFCYAEDKARAKKGQPEETVIAEPEEEKVPEKKEPTVDASREKFIALRERIRSIKL